MQLCDFELPRSITGQVIVLINELLRTHRHTHAPTHARTQPKGDCAWTATTLTQPPLKKGSYFFPLAKGSYTLHCDSMNQNSASIHIIALCQRKFCLY